MMADMPAVVGQDMTQSNALIAETARLIFTDPAYSQDEWKDAAVVFNFVKGRKNVFGYIFRSDGTWKAELPAMKIWMEAIERMFELQSLMERQTAKKWQRALVHIYRETTAFNITFEYDDPTRWTINPGNLEESVNALRP
jgi:hypothetical protein